jgi:hypothetical protein
MSRLLFVIFSLLLFAPLGLRAQETKSRGSTLRPDILAMSELAERRIRQSVVDLLGPESRAVVNVYIKSYPSIPTPKLKEVWQPNLHSLLFSDYLQPVLPDAEELLEKGSVLISGAEVTIRVEKYVDAALRQDVEDIAKNILKGIKTSVKVEASLPEPLALSQPDSSASMPAGAHEDPNFEGFVKRFSGLLLLLAGLFVLVGFLFVGLTLKTSAREIAEGLRSIKPASNSSSGGTLTLSAPELKSLPQASKGVSESRRVLPTSTPLSNSEINRNLEFVEKYIFESPMLFARSIKNDVEDLLGLKFLVAKVSPQAKKRLRDILGIEKILHANRYSSEQELVGFEAGGWIQGLIERIEMKKLAGGNIVEQALSNEDSLLLSNLPQDRLFEVARRINSPEAWRVATDFLSSDFLKKRSREIDTLTWKNLVKGSLVSDQEPVRQAAQAIIAEVGTGVSDNALVAKKKIESQELFVNQILPSLLDSIYSMELGEDDRFVNEIVKEAPDYAVLMDQFVWTPSKLDLFEDSILAALFERLDNEKKSFLLAILPSHHVRRFESFLPEGNVRKIVLDSTARLKASSNEKLRDQMRAFAREFLDSLRNQVQTGALVLREAASSSSAPSSSVTHLESADSPRLGESKALDDNRDEGERKAS